MHIPTSQFFHKETTILFGKKFTQKISRTSWKVINNQLDNRAQENSKWPHKFGSPPTPHLHLTLLLKALTKLYFHSSKVGWASSVAALYCSYFVWTFGSWWWTIGHSHHIYMPGQKDHPIVTKLSLISSGQDHGWKMESDGWQFYHQHEWMNEWMKSDHVLKPNV